MSNKILKCEWFTARLYKDWLFVYQGAFVAGVLGDKLTPVPLKNIEGIYHSLNREGIVIAFAQSKLHMTLRASHEEYLKLANYLLGMYDNEDLNNER